MSTKVILKTQRTWKCNSCNNWNEANKFAIIQLEKGNMLISSCKSCDYRSQLIQK